jgi:hypothetical protein
MLRSQLRISGRTQEDKRTAGLVGESFSRLAIVEFTRGHLVCANRKHVHVCVFGLNLALIASCDSQPSWVIL